MILLDTNVVIAAINDSPRRVADSVAHLGRQARPVAMSSIVLFELRFGIANSRRHGLNERRLANFLSGPVELLAFDGEDARAAGELRAALKAAGTTIGAYDVLIAGQALRHGATLVTVNTREFGRVPGLRIEDWTRG
jgi:tRNA(fMet)-specific endonuclease VapC